MSNIITRFRSTEIVGQRMADDIEPGQMQSTAFWEEPGQYVHKKCQGSGEYYRYPWI